MHKNIHNLISYGTVYIIYISRSNFTQLTQLCKTKNIRKSKGHMASSDFSSLFFFLKFLNVKQTAGPDHTCHLAISDLGLQHLSKYLSGEVMHYLVNTDNHLVGIPEGNFNKTCSMSLASV